MTQYESGDGVLAVSTYDAFDIIPSDRNNCRQLFGHREERTLSELGMY
jgi:hypothetical protein